MLRRRWRMLDEKRSIAVVCLVFIKVFILFLLQEKRNLMSINLRARAVEACQIYDPTTKLIILCRSPKTYKYKYKLIIKKKKN
jgi:hypothetical protein